MQLLAKNVKYFDTALFFVKWTWLLHTVDTQVAAQGIPLSLALSISDLVTSRFAELVLYLSFAHSVS
jgi:hypothetical protein